MVSKTLKEQFGTMPGCNIVGCGARKKENRTNVTFHRLPRNEVKKRKWLDIIGTESIRPKTKEIFICSLHFEDNAFNRTLEIVKLRDDALPSRHLLPRNKSSTPSVHEHEVTSTSSKHNASNSVAVAPMLKNNTGNCVTSGHPKYSVTSVSNESGGEVENQFYDAPSPLAPGSSSETESAMSFSSTTSQRDSTNNEIKNQELKMICRKQRNEIRRLKEIVRKQRRKIATFTNILKILTKQRS